MVKAVILVKSPKKLIAAKLSKMDYVYNSFPVSGQFDAVAFVKVDDLSQIREVTTKIQMIPGVERTETMMEIQ
ncbi:MAG: Lrp/AsnC ligand binding domain-containing protein [Thaumarchaeota archaeon]|nr:Lrp/AsnC ligand binding domain-containing protein [Nitrososphaerota archaeon]